MLGCVLGLAAGPATGLAVAGYPTTDPPPLCSGSAFSDLIGTAEDDRLAAGDRPQRLWGLSGSDDLAGSGRRASCLFGGRGGDRTRLGDGGGAAYGEEGPDRVLGTALDDVLSGAAGADVLVGSAGADTLLGGRGRDVVVGGAGDDAINPGDGVDAVVAGPGEDDIMTVDGRGEIVDCGPGSDRLVADRADLVVGCESVERAGGALPTLAVHPSPAASRDIVRFRAPVPRAAPDGAYRVIATAGCAPGTELVRLRAVGRPRTVRVGLRPPAGRWCASHVSAMLVLERRCGRRCSARLRAAGDDAARPAEPLARLRFDVAGPTGP